MIVYTKHYGQMCNCLWGMIPIIAYVLFKKEHLYVFNMRRSYVENFPVLMSNKYIHFVNLLGKEKPNVFFRGLGKLLTILCKPIEGELRNIPVGRNYTIRGWEHRRDVSFVSEEKHAIRTLFAPNDIVLERLNAYWRNYHGITVGVHIRRGDYIKHLGGKYFFGNEVYVEFMNQLRKLFANDNVRFLICSNEKIDQSYFGTSVFSIENSDGITDLYGLSMCDYIIGPPSSFSQWASFYGNVPLCFITDRHQQINLNDFSPIIRLDVYANGKQIYDVNE